MGPLADMRAFYRWLDNADDKELVRRRDVLEHAVKHQFTEEKVVADARYLLRKIEEEILARSFR